MVTNSPLSVCKCSAMRHETFENNQLSLWHIESIDMVISNMTRELISHVALVTSYRNLEIASFFKLQYLSCSMLGMIRRYLIYITYIYI